MQMLYRTGLLLLHLSGTPYMIGLIDRATLQFRDNRVEMLPEFCALVIHKSRQSVQEAQTLERRLDPMPIKNDHSF
jgi:hypothetical protein